MRRLFLGYSAIMMAPLLLMDDCWGWQNSVRQPLTLPRHPSQSNDSSMRWSAAAKRHGWCYCAPLRSIQNPSSSSQGRVLPSFLDDTLENGTSVNDDNKDDTILSYLPDHGAHIPPHFRALVHRATRQHMYGTTVADDDHELDETTTLLDALEAVLETEFRVRTNSRKYTVRFLDDDDEQPLPSPELVYILSLCALYQLPKDITLQFLRPLQRYHAYSFVAAFASRGWEGVAFPRGLAVRERRQRWQRRRAAQALCEAAATTSAPPKINRTQFLQALRVPTIASGATNAATTTTITTTTSPTKQRLYFPTGSLRRRTVRWWRRQTARLRRHGHAGVVSYAVLNCLWYTIGMTWQWRRHMPLDETTITTKALLQHYVTHFGYVYAAAQLVKVVKIGAAVAMAPWMQTHVLEPLTHGNGSSAVTTALLLTALVGIWATITGWPLIVWLWRGVATTAPPVAVRPTGLIWGV